MSSVWGQFLGNQTRFLSFPAAGLCLAQQKGMHGMLLPFPHSYTLLDHHAKSFQCSTSTRKPSQTSQNPLTHKMDLFVDSTLLVNVNLYLDTIRHTALNLPSSILPQHRSETTLALRMQCGERQAQSGQAQSVPGLSAGGVSKSRI